MTTYNRYLNQRIDNDKHALNLANQIFAKHQNGVMMTFFGQALTTDTATLVALHDKYAIDLKKTLDFVANLPEDLCHVCFDVAIALRDNQLPSTIKSGNAANAKDVVLYGFGRIGRILARLLMARPASTTGLQLKAIVVRPAGDDDLFKRASLLERDSVHGWFDGAVSVDQQNGGIVAGGRFIKVIYAQDPSEIDYTSYGINDALVIDNTGKYKDSEGLSKHLASAGVDKVLLTAPAKGDIKNVVYGVNDHTIGDDKIISAASCTTNAITPILKLIHDNYGIDNGHMETIHAFTNDQNLVDNHHKADRRGRAAPLNMVMTSTGAASAVAKAIPELKGKLTGNAIRVPTPNVSLAILNLNLQKSAICNKAFNTFIKTYADSEQWQHQIAYSDSTEAVSTDFVGCQKVAIFDSCATIIDGNRATLYVWYDNEMGYSTQVLRVAEKMLGMI